MNMFNPAHPGEVLKEAYLDPLNMTITEFARRIGITRKCASEFINKHSGMSIDLAYRLAQATGTTAETWLMMQVQYDLWVARKERLPEQIHVKRLSVAV